MCNTPVLALPNFERPFAIETGACDTGIGAVLVQDKRPVVYFNKALGVRNQKLSTYEKEFLAVMMAVDRWRAYLQRGPFVILTDHKSLFNLGDQLLDTKLQCKAMTKLVGLQFKFQYKRGADNTAADALSRMGHLLTADAMSICQPQWLQEVINSYATDAEAQELLTHLAMASPNETGHSLHQGVIRKHGKLWIGANIALQTKIISALHASAVGGHSGVTATHQRVKKMFVWKGIRATVEDFIRQCVVCQHAKHEHLKPAGKLQPLPIPTEPWHDISMDFVVPLKHPFTAVQVARAFWENVVKIHGVPETIVSNRDRIFTSVFWKDLMASTSTKLLHSTAYHPQTDGQTERVNQCLEMYLRCAVHDNPKHWRRWLAAAEFWYNSSHHASLNCSPFKALFGREPNLGAIPTWDENHAEAVEIDWAAHGADLRRQLEHAQARIKRKAERNRTERSFSVGEDVLLKLQPYAQNSLVNRPCAKLAYKFFGPFKVEEKIGSLAYRLALPVDCRIHPVFHVSQLKPFTASYALVFSELPRLPDLTSTEATPVAILEHRLVKKGAAPLVQIRVQWSTSAPEVTTWEDYEVLKNRFPAAGIWEGVASQGGANVTPSTSVNV